MEILSVANVTKIIKKNTIVNNLSFNIEAGEIVGFLGPNGAGKTTTIKMIVGLITATTGRITIAGHSVEDDFEQAISQLGAVIENPEFHNHLSGYDNLKLLSNLYPNVTKEDLDEISKDVGLNEKIHDRVKTYSLGMRQRLGLAQAMIHRPKLLILDEPTNGLDPMGIRELRNTLKNLASKQGVGILVSSHLLSEIELMCNRIIIIDHGTMLQQNTLDKTAKESAESLQKYSLTTTICDEVEVILNQYATSVELQGGEYKIELNKTAVPALIKAIVMANFPILKISIIITTLEDTFVSITQSNQTISK